MNNTQIARVLEEKIIPFWDRLKDAEYGGLYGGVTYDLDVVKDAPKGGIAAARMLWFYSAVYRILGRESGKENADHMYRFLRDRLIDRAYGGIYWMVAHTGEAPDSRKHVYAQAFAIYGLSEYYRATGEAGALTLAKDIFALIEEKGYDRGCGVYGEEYTRDWTPKDNIELSENGVLAPVTMNTYLHILEAYTNLYKAWSDPHVKKRLASLIADFQHRIYNPRERRFDVYFDKEWRPVLDMRSFGHDIEATWLIYDAVCTIGYDDTGIRRVIRDVGYAVADTGLDQAGYLWNEWVEGALDKTMVWWPQAEAMVGFYNLYQMTSDTRFAELVEGLWHCITGRLIDPRPGGEWYWSVSPSGNPIRRDIVMPWKTAYHNGRFHLEFIERMGRG